MAASRKVEPVPEVTLIKDDIQADSFLRTWLTRLVEKANKTRSYTATIDPASVSANSTSEQTFSVPGLTTNDVVEVNKPSHTSGLIIGNIRVSAADTLAITFANITGGAIDAASEDYEIIATEKDNF